MLQKRCSNFLHLVLDQCPPGRSEVVRQVYVDTFKHFKQLPQCQEMFGGTMQAMIAMMMYVVHVCVCVCVCVCVRACLRVCLCV